MLPRTIHRTSGRGEFGFYASRDFKREWELLLPETLVYDSVPTGWVKKKKIGSQYSCAKGNVLVNLEKGLASDLKPKFK